MPAYFICPGCKQKNYPNVTKPPGDNEIYKDRVCKGCGLKGIYWVKIKEMAEALQKEDGIATGLIAVGAFVDPGGSSTREETILERLSPDAELKEAYSQGSRTKKFLPTATLVKEGQCEGQCLHWIRRVLQGGDEIYHVSLDDKLELKRTQKKQVQGGAVTHVLGNRAEQQSRNQFNASVDRHDTAAATYKTAVARQNTAVTEFNLRVAQHQTLYNDMEAKFDRLLIGRKFKKTGTGAWEVPRSRAEEFNQLQAMWKTSEEEWEKQKPKLAEAPVQLERAPQWSYSAFWDQFSQKLDAYLDENLKVSKRRFSNIIAVTSHDRSSYKTAGQFVAAIVNDSGFCPGTCALISVGLKAAKGEAGGSIHGHAIAAHFKCSNELFLFDPNLGIFKSESKAGFRRTLETLLETVWTKDMKWDLEGNYGYSLFRTRDSEKEGNKRARSVPFSENPDYTAAEAKAEGITPRSIARQ